MPDRVPAAPKETFSRTQLPVLVAVVIVSALVIIVGGREPLQITVLVCGVLIVVLATVGAAVVRPGNSWDPTILWPALDLVGIAMMVAAVPTVRAVGLLAIIPIIWLAYVFGRLGIMLSVLGALFIGLLPWLPITPEGRDTEVIDIAALPIVVGIAALTIRSASLRFRGHQRRLRELSVEARTLLAEARDQELTVGAITETVGAGIAIFDPDGRVVMSNRASRAMVARAGATLGSGREREAPHVYGADRRTPLPRERQPAGRALAGDMLTEEIFWFGPPGDQIALMMSSQTLVRAEGDLLGTVVIAHDVTRLLESTQVREDFLAAVTHELKTPLTSIVGYIELLEDAVDVRDLGIADDLAVIRRNVERLFSVVNDLLSAGRRGADPRLHELDLVAVVRDVVVDLQPRAVAADVEISLDADKGVPVIGDPAHLGQIVANILGNAVKYSPGGGHVRVTVADENGAAVLAVSDDGIGMTPGESRQVFERFFRADGVREGAIPGVGLGLSIARDLVEQHDGVIEVESAPGLGSTFTVRLPLAEGPGSAVGAPVDSTDDRPRSSP